jgi:TATA-box binding protein (TBP) (component of TFIID and TFIIIB)
MEFTDLRISTMTCSGALRGNIDLDALFEAVSVVPDDGVTLGITHAINWQRTCVKPEGAPFGTRNFGKNVSIKLRVDASTASCINMKIFHNGGLQMTGVKTEAGGREAAQLAADIIHALGLVAERGAVDFRVRMINSDMRANCPLQRRSLYEAWRHEKDASISFDPITYPALKLMYFYTPNKPAAGQDGLCHCPVHCSTKLQAKCRRCLKVTVSLFESGCIIITGSISEEHAYLVRDIVKAKLLAREDVMPTSWSPDTIMQTMLNEHRARRL